MTLVAITINTRSVIYYQVLIDFLKDISVTVSLLFNYIGLLDKLSNDIKTD